MTSKLNKYAINHAFIYFQIRIFINEYNMQGLRVPLILLMIIPAAFR